MGCTAVASWNSVRNARQLQTFRIRPVVLVSLLALGLGCCAGAQTARETAALPDAPQAQTQTETQAQTEPSVTLRETPRNLLRDQAGIWTSPARIGVRDLEWLAPLALGTGAALATDHRAMSQVVSHDASFNNANIDASNAMIGGFIAAPVVLYGFGHFQQSAHAREAGILSGEAMLDSVVVEQGMKLIFWRERPALDSARGRFFQSGVGTDSSFPSSHSVVAWSAAAALAGEYPSRWTQLFVYSAATGISLTRVLGQEHFPSDVLVGSAAGWLVGHYVFRKHHRHWTR